jgi:hypothetical protein
MSRTTRGQWEVKCDIARPDPFLPFETNYLIREQENVVCPLLFLIIPKALVSPNV